MPLGFAASRFRRGASAVQGRRDNLGVRPRRTSTRGRRARRRGADACPGAAAPSARRRSPSARGRRPGPRPRRRSRGHRPAGRAPGLALRRRQAGRDQEVDQREVRPPGPGRSSGTSPATLRSVAGVEVVGRRTARGAPASAAAASSAPWTRAVASRPAGAGPSRRSGAASWRGHDGVDLGHRQQREPAAGTASTCRSSTCIKCWKSWYGRGPVGRRARPRARSSCRASVPSGAVSSGQDRAWTTSPVAPADQVDAGQDVAPLVGAADLELAASCSCSHR